MSGQDEALVLQGGKVKLLTQGRSIAAVDQGGVIIDYLRFTVLRDRLTNTRKVPADTLDVDVCHLLALEFSALLGFDLGDDRPGRDYYDHTTTILNAFGQEIGSVSGGGASQRDTFCFTLKGEGCTFARPGWEKRVTEFFADKFPKITRIDLARDCFKFGDLSIEAAVVAYFDHGFSYQNRLPKYSCHGGWMDQNMLGSIYAGGPVSQSAFDSADSVGNSRTFQVGKRESGKLCRIYEKGHQYGMMDDEWVRAEVELRSVNRVIPWDALARPGDYFAGAYEFCSWLVHNVDPVTIKTQTKVAELSIAAAMRWVERVVAPTLVAITSAVENHDWLDNLVVKHQGRSMPRSMRGLDHTGVMHGLKKYFDAQVVAPVVEVSHDYFTFKKEPGFTSMFYVHGLASPV